VLRPREGIPQRRRAFVRGDDLVAVGRKPQQACALGARERERRGRQFGKQRREYGAGIFARHSEHNVRAARILRFDFGAQDVHRKPLLRRLAHARRQLHEKNTRLAP